jgi:hypothetical protein
MNPQLALYKRLIDGLVELRTGVLGLWIKERGWPDLPKNREINELLSKLTPQEKDAVASIAQQARDGGIHDTLVFLNDEINQNGLRITQNSVEMAVEPYATELHWDWTCRREGDEWPEHQLDEKYK